MKGHPVTPLADVQRQLATALRRIDDLRMALLYCETVEDIRLVRRQAARTLKRDEELRDANRPRRTP